MVAEPTESRQSTGFREKTKEGSNVMPFLITLLVIALIVAFLFLSTLFIVPQQQAYIIERFGKFNKVQIGRAHV